MIYSAALLFVVTIGVLAYAATRSRDAVPAAATFTLREGGRLAIRLPFALIAASCLAELIPDDTVAALIGHDSGVQGIVIASFAGGLLPGGPMVSFPVALILAGEGAGTAQLIALLTGWSVFAFHRVISYESPIMGWRFVAVRMLSSLLVPILAGLATAAAIATFGDVSVGWR
ncbi:MAG: hypothetical protein AAGC70_02070 [Pseudomonadota bacterium]